MPSYFDDALAYTIANEGGSQYTNAPGDAGGPTKYGICLASYSGYCKTPKAAADVEAMTYDVARAIYRQLYWLPMQLDSVGSQVVAMAAFDLAVNVGVGEGAKLLQRAVGALADGSIGAKTIAAVNGMTTQDLMLNLFDQAQQFYIDLVVAKPSQIQWLSGWLKRTRKLNRLRAAGTPATLAAIKT